MKKSLSIGLVMGMLGAFLGGCLEEPSGGPDELPVLGTIGQALAPTEAPTLIGPSGTISDTTPLYQWSPIEGGCYYYYVWVNDAYGGAPIKKAIRETDVGCAGGAGTCQWESTELTPGNYRFYVLGIDEAYAAGPWSTGMTFQINVAPASAPVLLGPTGFTNLTPTYQWEPVSGGAYAYYVWVNDAYGATPVKQLVLEGDAGCPGGSGTCSYSSPALAAGSYGFYVRGQDTGGNPGPWSSGMTFTALASGGAVATDLLPGGDTYDRPYFRWTPVPGGAPEYQVWVNDSYGGTPVKPFLTEGEVDCEGGVGTCAWIGPTMPFGRYKFYIRTRENGVYGPLSAGSLFRVTWSCSPDTCATGGWDCGTPDNGCGDTLVASCGACTDPETCGGGGEPNVCGMPATCDDSIQNQGETGIDCGGPCPSCGSYLLISEYVEGTSNNKAVEIYNSHHASIDLTGCALRMFYNGSSTAGSTITMTATIPSHDVHVLCNSSAGLELAPYCDQTSGSLTFNGDDAVQLYCDSTSIDVIGQIGFDPGAEWGTGLISTADNTTRRTCSVTVGDPDGSDAFDPAIQWEGFDTDTFDGLGVHCP